MKFFFRAEPADVATSILRKSLVLGVALSPTSDFYYHHPQQSADSFRCPHPELMPSRFQTLLASWKQQVLNITDSDEACALPQFREIVSKGLDIVPLIVGELSKEPDFFLLRALREISGEDPIAPEDYGNVERMTASWLEWAKANELGAIETISIG